MDAGNVSTQFFPSEQKHSCRSPSGRTSATSPLYQPRPLRDTCCYGFSCGVFEEAGSLFKRVREEGSVLAVISAEHPRPNMGYCSFTGSQLRSMLEDVTSCTVTHGLKPGFSLTFEICHLCMGTDAGRGELECFGGSVGLSTTLSKGHNVVMTPLLLFVSWELCPGLQSQWLLYYCRETLGWVSPSGLVRSHHNFIFQLWVELCWFMHGLESTA